MKRNKTIVGLAAVAVALSLTSTTLAGTFGPVHATALVFKVSTLPAHTILEDGWIGVGGANSGSSTLAVLNDHDCADVTYSEQGVYRYAQYRDTPPVAIKTLGQRVHIANGVSVEESAVDEACATLGATEGSPIGTDPAATGEDPQAVGFGDLSLRFENIWFPTLNIPTAFDTLTEDYVSCLVAQTGSSPQFSSDVNRGASENEPIMPSESLAGSSLTSDCIAHDLDNPLGAATYSCDQAFDPDCVDMAPGLWATCVTALVLDPVSNTQGTETDYTWFWVDDLNAGLATQWGDPMNWDGEDWRDDFTSQQECDSLGSFTA